MSSCTSNDFAVFILTHGRPDNVKTLKTLRSSGYTGQVFLVVDDIDKTKDQYIKKYGDIVKVFNKKETAKTFDQGDNFDDMRAIVYARNACFDIANDIGVKTFLELDDDYTGFFFRFNKNLNYINKQIRVKNLNRVFDAMLGFYESTNIHSIALSQSGDFIGGDKSNFAQVVKLKRKCMNSFLLSTERPFKFVGRINEDVNTYTRLASTGLLMFTTNQISLTQTRTQSNEGGMTELYLDSGTYIKSFYSVMYHPSSVTVKLMQSKNKRLHHSVVWRNTTPMILEQKHKRVE
jgi:hypothetical protein